MEHELLVAAAGAGGAENGCRARKVGGLLGLDRQLDVVPTVRQTGFDRAPLVDELHAGFSIMAAVTPVEGKALAADADAPVVAEARLRELFAEMLLIRRFEEKVEERFRAGELPGFLHVAIGQEAVACGVCEALGPDDVISSTHRAHAHTLAKGTSANAVMAEMYGKREGCSHGYGGSMHLYDVARGNMGANAVVGGGLPQIAGAALAFKLRGEARVGAAFFGDGATNTGAFHESMNLAQLWKLPVLFVLENNGWAESTPASQQLPLAVEDMAMRAAAYGMTSMEVDGQDIEAVISATRVAREHAVSGQGPVFMNVRTYRLTGHFVGDPQVYRDKSEVRQLRETQDPIELLRARLGLTGEEFERFDAEATAAADASVEFARAGTDPDPQDALKWVYAEGSMEPNA
jgi:TPP-dependent pyruvate/acetoin dehydrogenase alpha subunit